MFNFFNELKKTLSHYSPQIIDSYHLVNVSGKMLYIEGHLGLISLSKESIKLKIKNGCVIIEGEGLILSELTDSTMKIVGNIKKTEVI